MIGLWKAIETYDESCNTKFSTYASVCIYNAIAHHLRPLSKKRQLGEVVSYDELVYEDITLLEMLPDSKGGPEDAYISNERYDMMLEAIEEVLPTLSQKSRDAVEYWKNSDYTATQKDISVALGISQSYVSRSLDMFRYRLKLKMEGK